ncbi:hypothetical protein Q9R46_14680 [Paenibacillus sp. RRE4]|uniref:BC1872 family protein n=1 Tax=Paenibacillus sp. RRE4 TaxID=2962587 RepID=UPI0028813B4B|nr:hypothetical protein [Paenibacillus sp. RRE4]MDT0123904.1 hypothetical protein [Paenibacillus sp. RRE4]
MTQTALTREQVENAEPGIDLNVMVAEHIFGWRRIAGPTHDYDGAVEHGEVLIPPNMSEAHAYAMMPPRGSVPIGYFVNRNWSTDMNDAWEVFASSGHRSAIETNHSGGYICNIKGADIYELNAPEAICKAALLAVLDI